MSKLPNAPLVEVIFELSWAVNAPKERDKFQFLLGDMYSSLKESYPVRLNLIQAPMPGLELPIEILANKPVYRFQNGNISYPLYQLGPGLLSVNTVDSVYTWEDFEKEIVKIIGQFVKSYDFESGMQFNVALKYIDFYPFNFNNNPYDFLRDNLHLDIKDNIHVGCTPHFLSFATGYLTDSGLFNYVINKGVVSPKGDGFLVETNLTIQISSSNLISDVTSWLQKAHEFLSGTFKSMTKGEMYNSFSN